jgi:hypothetical protein
MMTSTTDLVLGSQSTSTGATAYFDLSGATRGSSTVFFGYGTSTDVIIGATNTAEIYVHESFELNGSNLFVNANIGSA